MSDFSLELNEDQLQIQKWVHDFAENVIRPAAHEWDEREETPWPIIEEAAKVGLYSLEFFANATADPAGLMLALALEELAWGDAGIGLAIVGSTLAVTGIMANGTPEQWGEWLPQCFGTPEKIALGAFAVSEPDAGSDVSNLRTRAVYDEAKDEWVLNGTKTWITNGGIADVHVVVAAVDPELKARGQASFVIGPNTKGLSQGQKFKKHGIRASHTAEVILDDVRIPGSQLLGGKEKLDARLARAKEGQATKTQAAMATFEASRPLVGAQAIGIATSRVRVLARLRQGAKGVRQGDHREPGDRVQARRHAHGDRRGAAARVARVLDGREQEAVHRRRGLDEQAQGRRGRGQGHRGGDPDPRRLWLHARVPGRALAPRLEDLHDLRGHLRDPATGHGARHLRRPHPVVRSRLTPGRRARRWP